jgi:hypothetical protein
MRCSLSILESAPVALAKGPNLIAFCDTQGKEAVISVAQELPYLGIFFTPILDWRRHVTRVSNRARSTVRGLKVLGNSVREIKLDVWRKTYNAVVLARSRWVM